MLRCSWVLAIPSTAHAVWWESHITAIFQRHQNLSQSKPRGSAIRIGLDSSNDADTNKTVMQTAMSNIEDTHRVKQVAESPIETDYIAAHGFLEIWDDTKWCSKYVAIFLSRFLSWFSSPEECSRHFHENGDSMLNIPKNTIELKDVESLKTILNSRTISLSIGSRIFHLRAGNAKDALLWLHILIKYTPASSLGSIFDPIQNKSSNEIEEESHPNAHHM